MKLTSSAALESNPAASKEAAVSASCTNQQQQRNEISNHANRTDGRDPPDQPNRKNKIQKDNHIIMIIWKQQKSNKTKRTFTL